ncbi:MAG: DUF4270 domain-containing protein [Bacteroidales bacterium]|nr:DUF4270 domain-containing protein [Bacteroidales bacterium]
MTSFYRTVKNSAHQGLGIRLKHSLISFFAFTAFILSSCSDDPTNIGIGLLPEDDFVRIVSTDTVSIKAYTMYDESSVTTNSTELTAGGIRDIYFGTTTCEFITQLRLITPWNDYVYTVDSIFFRFLASEIDGDTSGVHYLRLYETGTFLRDTVEYFSNQDPDTIKFLGEYPLPALKADSSYSIRLENWVAEYLLRDTSMFLPATEFYTDYFKGLYVALRSEADPVLISMTAADSPLALTIHFHDTSDTKYTYSFVATERAVNYNKYKHDFTTADPDKQIKHINDLVTDTVVYLQGLKGVYTRLDLPSLSSFREEGRIAVNEARLYVPVLLDGVTFADSLMPPRIYLRYRDSEGNLEPVPDLLHDPGFLDGTYYKLKDYYIFNIPTFIQEYLEGEIDNPSVEMYYPSSFERNAIFKANGNNPTVRLEFSYSIY